MADDLFARAAADRTAAQAPLAARMRPRSLDEFVGQQHLVGPGGSLRTALERGRLWSVVLWGPPGVGKTTLARLAAGMTGRHFIQLSAVMAGVRDVRAAIDAAREQRGQFDRRTLLFLDETHRFNKAQQDALLPHVEDGTIALWGATTENPYFSINAPLRSRLQILRLHPLQPDEIRDIVQAALQDETRGLAATAAPFDAEALEFIVAGSGGDARQALNWLEASAEFAGEANLERIDAEVVAAATLERPVHYDRAGDEHFDTISAFIKSVRGSDPDAALFWLAKMIRAGEAPEFIARRIVILASEDIGNADPQALPLAVAAAAAVERLGLPEARYALAQTTIYLAAAAKSNAAGRSLDGALAAIEAGADLAVPLHLRTAAFDSTKAGTADHGYVYPHDFPGNYVRQAYLPKSLQGRAFYDGAGDGREQELWRALQARREPDAPPA